jgi:hypothetical protein
LVPFNQLNNFFKDDKFFYLKANNFFFSFISEGFFQNFFLKLFEKKNQVSLRSFFNFLDLKKGFFLDSSKFFFPFSKNFLKIRHRSNNYLRFFNLRGPDKLGKRKIKIKVKVKGKLR